MKRPTTELEVAVAIESASSKADAAGFQPGTPDWLAAQMQAMYDAGLLDVSGVEWPEPHILTVESRMKLTQPAHRAIKAAQAKGYLD